MRQLDAAQRLRNAAQALGTARIKLLTWVVVDDLPWVEIAKRLGLSTATYLPGRRGDRRAGAGNGPDAAPQM